MLPGMRASHTRASFVSGSRLSVQKYAPSPDSYLRVEGSGLWLLPPDIAEGDRSAGQEKMAAIAVRQSVEKMKKAAALNRRGSKILGKTAITAEGCMVDGLKADEDPFKWAMIFAETEWATFTLTTLDDMPYIQACDTEGCYNSRHF